MKIKTSKLESESDRHHLFRRGSLWFSGSLQQLKMPKCPKCQKEVYFAEKVTSLGKDWHRPCLKCEKCNKTLSSAHTQSMTANPTVTNPATPLCLDQKASVTVELRVTLTTEAGPRVENCTKVNGSGHNHCNVAIVMP
ncbi:hypothetical protein WMY93_017763 [Mugilogobius chulae]|uniref:Cysteine-rich protein 1 n=1 Tax=Mugilogobius chulae TaxID=88201 RepID=A0AAW0P0M7_9GOBI